MATYMCEQTFSRMKYVKNSLRTNLSDDNLRSLLMLGKSNLKPEMSAILACQCVHINVFYHIELFCFNLDGTEKSTTSNKAVYSKFGKADQNYGVCC